MNKYAAATLVAIPMLAASGLLYQSAREASAKDVQQTSEAGYVCPVTGEVLPCEKCCQLNK